MNVKTIISILLVFSCTFTYTHAQVTIGSGVEPAKGAILDLKEYEADIANGSFKTANKGLLMPRVSLMDLNSLEPIISNTDPNIALEKLNHTGLVVYHTGGNNMDAGMQIWDGEQWRRISENGNQADPSWFYMPGFPIDVSSADPQEIELYAEYSKQFGSIPGVPLIEESKLKFVVIGYDVDSFVPSSVEIVTVGGKQVLKYTARPAFIGPKSYLNIICQISR